MFWRPHSQPETGPLEQKAASFHELEEKQSDNKHFATDMPAVSLVSVSII